MNNIQAEKIKQQNYTPSNKITFEGNNKTFKPCYQCEINNVHGFIKLSGEKYGCFDSKKTYFINKDGSGRLSTPWGAKEYKKGTFNEILKKAKEFCDKNNSLNLPQDDIEILFDLAKSKIK